MLNSDFFEGIKNLFPRFLRYFFMGIRGDFNRFPAALSVIWPMFFTGFVSMILAFIAAGMGFPLYKDLMLSIFEQENLAFWYALIAVILITGGIYTLQQNAGLYKAEKSDFGISRISKGQFYKILWVLILLVVADGAMNWGGRKTKLDNEFSTDFEEANGDDFVYTKQARIEQLSTWIEQLNTAKGCKGHSACKNSGVCPYEGKGAAHIPGGKLTKFGSAMLRKYTEERGLLSELALSAEQQYNKLRGVKTGTVEAVGWTKKYLNYLWLVVIYILMFVLCIVSAGYMLIVEKESGILPKYDQLLTEENEAIARQRMRRTESKNKTNEYTMAELQKMERSRSMQRDKRLGKFQTQYNGNPNENDFMFSSSPPLSGDNNVVPLHSHFETHGNLAVDPISQPNQSSDLEKKFEEMQAEIQKLRDQAAKK